MTEKNIHDVEAPVGCCKVQRSRASRSNRLYSFFGAIFPRQPPCIDICPVFNQIENNSDIIVATCGMNSIDPIDN